ncbi:MAG: DcaP family trimeric outer membrane transporter, partial [Marinobacter sp.]|uniref:DcaP family trimeric outer membrane transporter n=1 Tax=Marinobacter sp. TaxID=50741 RepID=UPI003298DE09
MKIKPIAAALLTLGTLAAANVSMAGETEDRIAELERQLAELKSMITSHQQATVVNQQATAANAVEIEEARPSKKGTKFQYGGFIQLDMAASSYSEGKPGNKLIEDFLVPSLIPVSDGSGSSYDTTNLHAKTSRLFFTTATDTDPGKISTRIEMDFLLGNSGDERISNSWNSRLRHAFVKWDYDEGKSLLAGQSWSTFFNVSALPNQIDFVGPVGTLFNRQPQIRWTSGGLQLAVENPATRLNWDVDGSLSTAFDDYHEGLPDLVARYNGKMGGLSWSAAGIARELSYDNGATDDAQMAYGLSLSGKWMLGKDDLRFMFNYGDGLGRYLGLNSFNDGYVGADGDIETIDQ